MVAYFFYGRKGQLAELHICERPCNGVEFQNAEIVKVWDKREARLVCKRRNIICYDF